MFINKTTGTMKRKILAVTGSRAEYGLLLPVLEKLVESESLELLLIVTGAHLLPKYGNTVQEIIKDGFPVKTIQMYRSSDDSLSERSHAFARGVSGFTKLIGRNKPDFILLLGDRIEPFSAAIASSMLGVPIAHIHGGDTSDCGQIDDSIRHSISKFASIHFAASKKSAERLRKMGEMPWRIFNVGSPGLDAVLRHNIASKEAIFKELDLDPDKTTMLCLQHSVTLEKDDAKRQMSETIEAIKEAGLQTVVIYPNNDPGSADVISVIESSRNIPNIRIVRNLEHVKFISLMKFASVMIGNSSSGVTESASFKLPSISIGTRQTGRECAKNVLFVGHNKKEIIGAIRNALHGNKFKKALRSCRNPYGDGHASERIVEVLEKIPINLSLMRKRISY